MDDEIEDTLELRELLAKVNKSQLRNDAQEFIQVYNLGLNGGVVLGSVRVWWRLFGADFMAECSVRRPHCIGPRRLRATGEGRADALEALAGVVAQFFNPLQRVAKGVGSPRVRR